MERTDLELAAKRRLIKEYYCAKRQELLNETCIMSDRIRFESDYNSSMVLDMTAEQIKVLDGSELVESIGLYDEQSPTETASESAASMTKEQFLDLVISEIVKASLFKEHEIASYIYPTIKKGDIDNDGMISAIDASYVLSAYAYSETGKKIALNYELFDYNDDGLIDAIDASRILADYAWNMTH